MSDGTSTAARRLALGLSGLGLLALSGSTALAAGPWPVRLPSWWPLAGRGAPLPGAHGPVVLTAPGWWPYALAAVCGVAAALLAGTRPRGPSRLPLAAPDTALRTRALRDAVKARTRAVPGVARCRTRVTGRRLRLLVHLDVALHPGATPEEVLPELSALQSNLEKALAPRTVLLQVRFRRARLPLPRGGRT
ncbi:MULTISPECIES: hypothetical protein [unclassified Streptomyces]|uniref:hypothetical protein n=1 Tax=unclassified Streptomyces TaxID=2593676 RepID=UPI003816FFE0